MLIITSMIGILSGWVESPGVGVLVLILVFDLVTFGIGYVIGLPSNKKTGDKR